MTRTRLNRSCIALVLAAGAAATAVGASAAEPRDGRGRYGGGGSIYQQEVAVCAHIPQDRAACIREAGAARQEARRGGLTAAPDYMGNALQRCATQPAAERQACEQRVRGTGNTSIDGSVLGGGVIRETVTPVTPGAPR